MLESPAGNSFVILWKYEIPNHSAPIPITQQMFYLWMISLSDSTDRQLITGERETAVRTGMGLSTAQGETSDNHRAQLEPVLRSSNKVHFTVFA